VPMSSSSKKRWIHGSAAWIVWRGAPADSASRTLQYAHKGGRVLVLRRRIAMTTQAARPITPAKITSDTLARIRAGGEQLPISHIAPAVMQRKVSSNCEGNHASPSCAFL